MAESIVGGFRRRNNIGQRLIGGDFAVIPVENFSTTPKMVGDCSVNTLQGEFSLLLSERNGCWLSPGGDICFFGVTERW
jgi:hypothetical protein